MLMSSRSREAKVSMIPDFARSGFTDASMGSTIPGFYSPSGGEGILEVDRSTYNALQILRDYNGMTEDALYQMACDPAIGDEHRDEAIRIWRIREATLRERP